jgi:quercetin dioxygenase-like cupin family protein
MTGDAVTVAPHLYNVVLENDRVRVLEVRGRPGDKTELHSHPAMVAIAITDGTFRFTSPDGQTMEAELKAGQAMYQPPVEHMTEITGTTEAQVLLVELK